MEIDENQHKVYDDICECSRINEIVNGVGGIPITIIRFNPDKIYNNYNNILYNTKKCPQLKHPVVKKVNLS